MITALALALSMMLAQTTPPDATPAPGAPADAGPPAAGPSPRIPGEPLPPGAPTDSYELSAWCYGALDEYLGIYDRVKPDLRDIDHMFGTSVVEDDPYHSDMDAARVELKMIGESVTQAEKASPRPISEAGAAAVRQGRSIWSVAEAKSSRELARAWLLWALPDRCDSNARELTQRSILFGKALNYNNAPPPSQTDSQPAPAPDQGSPPANAAAPAPPAAAPDAQASPTTDTNVPASTATDAAGAPAANAPSPNPPTTSDPAVPALPDPAAVSSAPLPPAAGGTRQRRP